MKHRHQWDCARCLRCGVRACSEEARYQCGVSAPRLRVVPRDLAHAAALEHARRGAKKRRARFIELHGIEALRAKNARDQRRSRARKAAALAEGRDPALSSADGR